MHIETGRSQGRVSTRYGVRDAYMHVRTSRVSAMRQVRDGSAEADIGCLSARRDNN